MNLQRRLLLTTLPALLVQPLLPPALADELSGFFLQHEQMTGGHIGLYAHDLQNGRTLAWRADERFVMCSTFKMSLAACVLSRVDKGQDQLHRFIRYGAGDLVEHAPVAKQNLAKGGMTVEAMCAAAVEFSDNTCANILLAGIGGPPALTEFWRATGDAVSRLDQNEPMLNFTPAGHVENTTTPAAMAGNLRRFLLGDVLSPASRELLTGWMLNCQTGLDLLRAGLPGWKVADKTGNNGIDALGDIAMTWPSPGRAVVICSYTRGGSIKDSDQLRPIFAAIGRLAGSRLG